MTISQRRIVSPLVRAASLMALRTAGLLRPALAQGAREPLARKPIPAPLRWSSSRARRVRSSLRVAGAPVQVRALVQVRAREPEHVRSLRS